MTRVAHGDPLILPPPVTIAQNDMTDLLIPGLTLICGLAGGFAARRRRRTLETQMLKCAKRMDTAEGPRASHGSDLLVHDMEMSWHHEAR